MKRLRNINNLAIFILIIFAIACGSGETRKFTGKLETKVKNASDYSEVTSGDDDAEISIVKKSDKEATLIVKKIKSDNNKLFLETCKLEITLESGENWRLPSTKCKTDKSEMDVFGTISLADKKMLLQLTGEFTSLKYSWRFEGAEIK